jgi:hypothetical protein
MSLSSLKPTRQFSAELRPFNRFSITLLEKEKALFHEQKWPTPQSVVVIQEFQGQQYGIRPLSRSDLDGILQHGDIGVKYTPIDLALTEQPDFLTLLAQEGQTHAFIIASRSEFVSRAALKPDRDDGASKLYCHIDSPRVGSGCDFPGNYHFFRIVPSKDDPEDSNKLAAELALDWYASPNALKYDPLLRTDMFISDLKTVELEVLSALRHDSDKAPPQYCSEFPFTVHSLVRGRPLFEIGESLVGLSSKLEDFSFDATLGKFVSADRVGTALSRYIDGSANSIPSQTQRDMLARVAAATLGQGPIARTVQELLRLHYPAVIFPHDFTRAAKGDAALKPSARIVYIGTLENPSASQK